MALVVFGAKLLSTKAASGACIPMNLSSTTAVLAPWMSFAVVAFVESHNVILLKCRNLTDYDAFGGGLVTAQTIATTQSTSVQPRKKFSMTMAA